jgi:hypothetical protein
MSSHREAPGISKDPVADSTDVYAFVSPDKQDTVTPIANYVPLQAPAGGPNFYEFGDDVVYQIHTDNDRDGLADVTYIFRFTTEVADPDTFGGDLAGFPNGRRVIDDVVAIELRALAGVTYPLIDKSYKPDPAAGIVTDGLTPADLTAPYLGTFPYLGVPHSGFTTPSFMG